MDKEKARRDDQFIDLVVHLNKKINNKKNVQIRRAGASYEITCPNPRHPKEKRGHNSFRCKPDKNGVWRFRCFNEACQSPSGDGFKGDVFDYVQYMLCCDLPEAARYVAQFYGYELNGEFQISDKKRKELTLWKEVATISYYFLTQTWEGKSKGLKYLRQRGITDESINKFFLGYAPGGVKMKNILLKKGFTEEYLKEKGLLNKDMNDMFFKRVIFPFPLYGRSIQSDDKYPHLYVKGHNEGLYNYKRARTKETVILSESHLDLIVIDQALNQLGDGEEKLADKVGVLSSFGTNGFKEEYIDNMKNAAIKRIIIVYDGDFEGRKAAIKVGHMLQDHGYIVRIAEMPWDIDPNEYFTVRKKTNEDFYNLINSAITPIEFEVKFIMDQHITNSFSDKIETIYAIAPLFEKIKIPNLTGELLVNYISERLGVSKSQVLNAIKKNK